MRIGIDARMLGSAPGIGRYIDCLTRELFRIDTENEYVLFLREPIFSRYVVPHARVRKNKAPERWYSFAEQVLLPLRCARAKLDLLFVPQFNVPFFVPCPFVVTIHDVTQLYMPGPVQARSFLRQRAFRFVFRHAVERARSVIAVSRYTKEEIIRNFGGNPEKIHVIYEGPGFAAGVPEARGPDLASQRSFEVPRGEYVLAVGVWRPHKNFTGLLDAFAQLRKDPEFSSLKLVLVGEEDPRYPEVRQRIGALALTPYVIAAGKVSDEALTVCYQNARAVVVPSFYEGLGLVGLEALRFGVPVAASRSAALPEILGNAARYFDPHDSQQMASALAAVLRDESERKRILSQAPVVLARYSWERAAQETLAVFRQAYGE